LNIILGIVKKVGSLKIIHERYKKSGSSIAQEFYAQFDDAIQYNKDIKQFLSKVISCPYFDII
jgi:hypothetical protein